MDDADSGNPDEIAMDKFLSGMRWFFLIGGFIYCNLKPPQTYYEITAIILYYIIAILSRMWWSFSEPNMTICESFSTFGVFYMPPSEWGPVLSEYGYLTGTVLAILIYSVNWFLWNKPSLKSKDIKRVISLMKKKDKGEPNQIYEVIHYAWLTWHCGSPMLRIEASGWISPCDNNFVCQKCDCAFSYYGD